MNEYHPHTYYFFQTYFNLDKIPSWYCRKKELIAALAQFHDNKQKQVDKEELKTQFFYLSRRFRISYQHLNLMLGIMLTDLSDPYGTLLDFLSLAEPKLIRRRNQCDCQTEQTK